MWLGNLQILYMSIRLIGVNFGCNLLISQHHMAHTMTTVFNYGNQQIVRVGITSLQHYAIHINPGVLTVALSWDILLVSVKSFKK